MYTFGLTMIIVEVLYGLWKMWQIQGENYDRFGDGCWVSYESFKEIFCELRHELHYMSKSVSLCHELRHKFPHEL